MSAGEIVRASKRERLRLRDLGERYRSENPNLSDEDEERLRTSEGVLAEEKRRRDGALLDDLRGLARAYRDAAKHVEAYRADSLVVAARNGGEALLARVEGAKTDKEREAANKAALAWLVSGPERVRLDPKRGPVLLNEINGYLWGHDENGRGFDPSVRGSAALAAGDRVPRAHRSGASAHVRYRVRSVPRNTSVRASIGARRWHGRPVRQTVRVVPLLHLRAEHWSPAAWVLRGHR